MDSHEPTRTSSVSKAGFHIGIAGVLAIIAGIVALWMMFQPAPPKRIVIASGPTGGAYNAFAKRYADYFAKNGYELVVKTTAGSIENYQLLSDPRSDVDVALVQGGTTPAVGGDAGLKALCSLYFEPLWVFYRGEKPITRISELGGKRLAIGPANSGSRALALTLLTDNGITPENSAGTILLDLGGAAAADALKSGNADAVFLVIAAENAVIQDLIGTADLRLMSFEQADAYACRHSYLSRVTLHRGVMDLGRDYPPQNVDMLAPAATLVGRAGLHHGTVELLVRAAQAIHSGPTILSPAGRFPSAQLTDLPINGDASYYLRTPPSRWSRSLPFWLKSLVDRLIILLIPLAALLVPLVRLAPAVWRWRMRARVCKWYTRLRQIEMETVSGAPQIVLEANMQRLEDIEQRVSHLSVPRGFMPDLYNLRLHIDRLRDKIKYRQAQERLP